MPQRGAAFRDAQAPTLPRLGRNCDNALNFLVNGLNLGKWEDWPCPSLLMAMVNAQIQSQVDWPTHWGEKLDL